MVDLLWHLSFFGFRHPWDHLAVCKCLYYTIGTRQLCIKAEKPWPHTKGLSSQEGAQAYGIQNLFSIQQPSSAKVARQTCNYPMLHQLTDLITHLNQAEVEKKYA